MPDQASTRAGPGAGPRTQPESSTPELDPGPHRLLDLGLDQWARLGSQPGVRQRAYTRWPPLWSPCQGLPTDQIPVADLIRAPWLIPTPKLMAW